MRALTLEGENRHVLAENRREIAKIYAHAAEKLKELQNETNN